MVTQFKQTNGGVQEVIVAAAHELKAPLVLMRHLTQTLKESSHSGDISLDHILARLEFTNERMLRLVQQLTVSYRLEQDNQLYFSFATEPLNINEVCADALHELTPYAREHNQQLQLKSQHCPHMALANRDILHDIIINLVDNAIRHTPAGGTVIVGSHCRDERVRLHVQDRGHMVRSAELKALRANLGRPQPLSGQAGTSGLGLYIVGQFAEAMGATLGVGQHAEGARFFVDLIRSRQLQLL